MIIEGKKMYNNGFVDNGTLHTHYAAKEDWNNPPPPYTINAQVRPRSLKIPVTSTLSPDFEYSLHES